MSKNIIKIINITFVFLFFNSFISIPVVSSNVPRPFIWTQESGVVGIVNLNGGASDINDEGQVVGRVNQNAFKWTTESGFIDILGVQCEWECDASGINNLGKIVGMNRTLSGQG